MGNERNYQSRFNRIEDLIGRDQIDEYVQRSNIPCYVLNPAGSYLSTIGTKDKMPVCQTGKTENEIAALVTCRAEWMSDVATARETVYEHRCRANGVRRQFAALRVGEEIVGYVAGPELPSLRKSGRERDGEAAAPAPDQYPGLCADEIAKVARQLSRRLASERGLRILTNGVRDLAATKTTANALLTALNTLSELFPSSQVKLWRYVQAKGELNEFGERGLRDPVIEQVIKAHTNIEKAAFEQRTTQTSANAIAAPIPGGDGQVLGVIVVYSAVANGVRSTGVQTIEVLATSTGIALERSRFRKTAESIESQFPKPAEHFNWVDTVAELMVRRIETGREASLARGELFQALLHTAVEISKAKRGSVRAVVSRALPVLYHEGPGWDEQNLKQTHQDTSSASWRAVKTRQPHLIPDTRQAPQDYTPQFPDALSNYCLPILLRGEAAAVLTLQSTEPDFFKAGQRYVLRSMAAQCGDVLERLTDIQDRWLTRFEADLDKTAADMQADPGVKFRDVIAAVSIVAVTEARKILGAHGCSIFLETPDKAQLLLEASTSPSYGDRPSYNVNEGLTGWVFSEGKTLRLRDIKDDLELRRVDKKLKWQKKEWGEIDHSTVKDSFGFLAAPLICRAQTLGVIRCSLKERPQEAFDFADEILIKAIANLVARRLDELRSREDSATRIGTLASLVQLDSRLAATHDLRAVGTIILEHVRDSTFAVAAHLRFLDNERKILRLAEAESPLKEHIPDQIAMDDPDSVTAAQAREGASIFLARITDDDNDWPAADRKKAALWHKIVQSVIDKAGREKAGRENLAVWVYSGAILVLKHDGKVVGTLLLEWSTKQDFSKERQNELTTLADRCASAVHAALAHQDQLREIRDAGLAFFTNPDHPDPPHGSTNLGHAAPGMEKPVLVLDVVVKRFLAESLERSEIDSGLVRLLDKDRQKWVLKDKPQTKDGAVGPHPGLLHDDLEVRSDNFLARALREKQSFVPSDEELSHFRKQLHGSTQGEYVNKLSWLRIFPLWGESCIGFLALTSPSSKQPDDASIFVLEALSVFAASAIISAQRLDEERLNTPLALLGAMLGAFFGHEGGEVIAGVLRLLEQIKTPETPRDRIEEHAEEAEGLIQEIANKILDMGHFGDPPSDHVSVNEIVADMALKAQDRLSGDFKKIAVTQTEGADVPTVRVNPHHITEALRMLLRNSKDAMPHGGLIEISTGREDDETFVRVKDNGTGMTKETLERAPELFYTTKEPTEDKKVRGLGLPVVELLVRRNQGRVHIKSIREEGTTVTIYFPIEGGADA